MILYLNFFLLYSITLNNNKTLAPKHVYIVEAQHKRLIQKQKLKVKPHHFHRHCKDS